MRILIVHNREVSAYPPVRSLIQALLANGHKVTIMTRDDKNILKEYECDNFSVHRLLPYQNGNMLGEIIAFKNNRRQIRTMVEKYMENNDVIWTTTDSTVREIGEILLKYKHVMGLFELIEYLPLIPKQNIIKFNIKKYAQKAYRVVVPEENRAYIQQVWWDLPQTPAVLPNKPYDINVDESNISSELKEILKAMEEEKRKIILYQGVFSPERNLRAFAEAVSECCDRYCLYIMGAENAYQADLCKNFPDVKYIPFQNPPTHLLVTKRADIGILPYKPTIVDNNSVLNALYCAPNKIYEYAAFGLPMIGSNVLGLKQPFEKYDIGCCCKQLDKKHIFEAINKIGDNYEKMSGNCKMFYSSIDLDAIVNEILNC